MLPNPVAYFAGYIERETGIIYSSNNDYQLKMRLEEICRTENISTIDELARLFQSPNVSLSLKQKLLDTSTNNETLFFRDPKCFTSIEIFLIDLLKFVDLHEIRIWSAASSTGQEALSVAMILDELFSKGKIPNFSILATDISDKAIKKGKSGLYTEFETSRGLSPERKGKYFTKEGDQWKVNPALHSKIKFSYNNLIRSSVYDTFHIILLRNVLIYQKVEMKKMVIENLSKQLENQGALVLGAGETLVGINDNFHVELVDGVSFYKKNIMVKKNIA
jgi:chemotaxis protein methyltransferase CheR